MPLGFRDAMKILSSLSPPVSAYLLYRWYCGVITLITYLGFMRFLILFVLYNHLLPLRILRFMPFISPFILAIALKCQLNRCDLICVYRLSSAFRNVIIKWVIYSMLFKFSSLPSFMLFVYKLDANAFIHHLFGMAFYNDVENDIIADGCSLLCLVLYITVDHRKYITHAILFIRSLLKMKLRSFVKCVSFKLFTGLVDVLRQ